MKSIVSVLLVLSVLCTLTACGKKEEQSDNGAAKTAQTTVATQSDGHTTLPSLHTTATQMTTHPTSWRTETITPTTTTEPTATTTDPNDAIVISGDFYISDSEGTRWVEDADVVNAEVTWQEGDTADSTLSPIMVITLSEEGKQRFAEATEANLNKLLYVWVGDMLLATPIVSGIIDSGELVIVFNNWDEDTVEDIQQIAEAIMA